MTDLLRIAGLEAFYGKSRVLRGLDLHVGEGEIVSLLGRNGAGRSTTLKAVMGLVECTGSIRWRGEDIRGLPVFGIARKGVGYVPESRDVFPTLTVEQNLMLGLKGRGRSRWTLRDMYALFPQLEMRRRVAAGVLSGGEQQMLALGRTLMGDPELVMVDEPTEGLAPLVVEQVADWLQTLQARGVAVLLVEQKLAMALEISQRVYVLGQGEIVFEGTAGQLRANPAVEREWLGV